MSTAVLNEDMRIGARPPVEYASHPDRGRRHAYHHHLAGIGDEEARRM